MKKCFVLIMCLIFGVSIISAQDYNLPKAQRDIVRNWLKGFSYYRVAVENDCDSDNLTDARNEHLGGYYQPYYVEGDFNRDTIEDFALALIDKRKTESKFSIVIFHGKTTGGFMASPAYHAKNFSLERGGLVKTGFGASRLSAVNFDSWHGAIFTFAKNRYTARGE